ncbi:MAG: VWA domain-containing protein [Deltaproteobacteria bacterium]|nr:VWA domain-containing protein [Deltaproteobacteria bacterium]
MRARIAILCLLAGLSCTSGPVSNNDRWGIDCAAEPVELPDLGEPWLVLEAPVSDASLETLLPWVELRGRVGVGPRGPQDVVLAIDTSGSVFGPSGADLDGDGVIGRPACDYFGYARLRCRGYKRWTTDFDDIVLKVEIAAALQLVGLLNPETTRIGMVKFGGTAWVEQPVGEVDGVKRALERFRYVMRGGTDIAAALQKSLELLELAPPIAGQETQRTILLLSDGVIALPYAAHEREIDEAIAAAVHRARAAGTRIFAFGVGETEGTGPTLLWNLARYTRGRHVSVPAAREIAVELPLVSLSGVSDVELANETTGGHGRATRIFPDGSFDGLLPLAEGDNTLRVVATLEDGRRLETRTRIRWSPPPEPSAADRATSAALLEALRTRTRATDEAARVHAERRRRRLQLLELEPEDPNAPVE